MDGRMIGMLPLSGEVWARDADGPPGLDWCRQFVGGSVQVVEVTMGQSRCQMLINEDGKGSGLPLNRAASLLWFAEQRRAAGYYVPSEELDVIVGPALLLIGAAQWQ
jgi:hypothetical protein